MNKESIEEILKNIGNEDVPGDVHKIAEEASRDFSKSLIPQKQPKHFILQEHIMKSRIPKLAVAAAVIILVVLGGLPFLSHKESGVALADVLAKVEQARAFIYKMKMTITGDMISNTSAKKQQMQGTTLISNEYGMKWEMGFVDPNTGRETTQQMYVLPDQKIAISIMPEMKKYMQMEFDDDLLARMKKQNNEPREMIKQIMSSEYKELGRSVIDGIEVEGFQASGSPLFGGSGSKVTLWVDSEKWLPVRMEMDIKIDENMQATGVVYGYQWDIAVEASEFQPVIPEDYTSLTEKPIQIPSGDEQGAVEGLRFFAEISGKYPKDLNMLTLMKEFSTMNDSQNLTGAGLKWKEEMKSLDKEKNIEKAMNMMLPIQSLSMFFMRLVQDKKEPAYYGESVSPDDTNAVLMRWKDSDNQYRVIFGDLTTADVTAEQLTELEALQPK